MRKRYVIREIIVWTILLMIVFCAIIFSYSKVFVEPNVYNIEFKDIDGITKGSPVRFMGINIGHVRHLKSRKKHVEVQILVTKKDIKIPNGTVARVEFYGLGGSKSIELMPADGSTNVGIVTGDNIRINDVILEAIGLVDVVEEIEKFVKGIDKDATKNALDSISKFKTDNISKMNKNIENARSNIGNSTLSIKEKEKNLEDKVNNINKNIRKRK